ncbi:MAG: serine/threonine-protein kinase [Vulcanimicrobiota bacterium]
MRKLLLFLLLTVPGLAEDAHFWVTFYTEPPSQIRLERLRADVSVWSGQRVALSWDEEQLAKPVQMDLTVRAPFTGQEFHFEEVVIPSKLKADGRWPPAEVHRFALSSRVRLLFWLHDYGIGLLALPVLATLGWWAVIRPRRLRLAQQLARAQRLEELQPVGDEDPLLGQRLGKYRLTNELGRGGMATVYRGLPDETLDDQDAVAVKVLSNLRDDTFKARFRREIRVMAEMHHPNIVKVLDFGEQDGRLYLAMELVRGQTLRDWAHPRRLTPPQVADLLGPVSSALEYAHRKGVIHRDLKPENVMLTDEQRVLVMDFGLARRSSFDTVTQTGNILGTPLYMAPEQFEGEIDAASDQYALGIMAFELLTGELPFFHTEAIQLIMAHLQEEAPLVSSRDPALAPLDAVVARMLAKSKNDRYPTIAAAGEALCQAASRAASRAES